MISITFLVASFSSFLALIMLVRNWRLNKHVLFFSFYLLIVSHASMLYDTILNGGSAHFLMLLIGNAGPLFFLAGPLFYFFIRGLVVENRGFEDKDLLHFVPFFINMIILIPYLFSPIENKLEIAENSLQDISYYMNTVLTYFPVWVGNLFRNVVILIYIVWSMVLLIKVYHKRIKDASGAIQKQCKANYLWLTMIALSSIMLVILHIGLALYFRYDYLMLDQIYFDEIYVLSIVVNSFFPLMILLNPGILFGLPMNKVLNPIIQPKMIDPKGNYKYNVLEAADKVNTYSGYFDTLSRRIISFIEKSKPYVNPGFTTHDLSRMFAVPEHHIHFCVKYYIGKSFKKLLRDYRVTHAKTLMTKSPDLHMDKLTDIAYESGFDGYLQFKKAFKKVEKITLDQWLALKA